MAQITTLGQKAGLTIAFTPAIIGAPVNGCARWFRKRPLVQLSDRWKRYDIFWFSLFHELGHILLHGRKDLLIIEQVEEGQEDDPREKEANDFAVKWTFPNEAYNELVFKQKNPSEEDIISIAASTGTHPSLVVGRLQREKVIPHGRYRNLLPQVCFPE